MASNAGNGGSAAKAVKGDRFWQRLMDMAKIGATGRGGTNRQALTSEDGQARVLLIRWAKDRGFAASVDDFGNLFLHRLGSDSSLSPVVTGSHLDTQPTGGKFDGVFGVLASFEALEALEDAGIRTRRPIDLAVWINEEGSRFQPPMMGSAVFVGELSMDVALKAVDKSGIGVAECLEQTTKTMNVKEHRSFGFPIHAYVEAHIEQGPVLEQTGKIIGVVTGIQGSRWYAVEVLGEEGHAGTTLRRSRKDALVAAIRMVNALYELTQDDTETVKFTVGRFEVFPGSPNIVPGRVFFTVDIRHPDNEVLSGLCDQVEPICKAQAGPCTVSVTETLNSPSMAFDRSVVDVVRQVAQRLNLPHMDIMSGPGHDAKLMASRYPSGMIFVPCEKGISHAEAEYASPKDLAAGARVLAEVLVELAGR